MKNILNFIFLASLPILIIVGCKKDKKDEDKTDPTPKNHFVYRNTNYSLEKGLIDEHGKIENGAYVYSLVMCNGVVFHYENGEMDSVSGFGEVLYFSIYSSNSEGLDNGIYLFEDSELGKEGTFDFGVMALNYDWSNEEGTEIEIRNGKIRLYSKLDMK